MNRNHTALFLAVAMLLFTVPTAAAGDLAGASGQCFDDDGSGGNAHLAVTEEGNVERSGLADADNPENNPPEGGAVDAVVALTDDNGEPESGNGCTAADDSRQDYLEVHVNGEQVCYDGDVNGPDSADCPTRT